MQKNLHSSRLLIAVATLALVTSAAPAPARAQDPTPGAALTETAPVTDVVGITDTVEVAPTAPVAVTEDATVISPAATFATKVHVPLVNKNWPPSTVFGVESSALSASASGIFGTGAAWIRRNGLKWADVEPTEGARNWNAASAIEADMVAASQQNRKLILIIHGTPTWARQSAQFYCGPIRNDKIGAFAAFVRDAVARYSKPPYNVKYWEIWNEQDGIAASTAIEPFGCWANTADPYWGGGYYASVLQSVAPQIRAADPQAKILIGGLLLDSNPNDLPSGNYPFPNFGKYLEGILRAGGGPYFDGVSFHAYDFYDNASNTLGVYRSPSWKTAWNTTGPVLIAKANFIKGVLNQFGVSGKFLINTEVGMICYKCASIPSNYEMSKVYYMPQAYAAALAVGLIGNVWYSYEGWFGSQLVEPSYTAYKTAVAKLGGATYVGPIGNGDVGAAGVKGYKLARDGKNVWVIWSGDGGAKSITLPSTPASITDPLGASQAAAASFQLTVKPLYIEFP
jgi:hypothetical protein